MEETLQRDEGGEGSSSPGGNSMQQELPRPTSSQGHNEQRNLGTKLESEEAAG